MANPLPPELRWLDVQIKPFLRWHTLSFLSFATGGLLTLSQPLPMKWLIDKVLPERNAMLLLAGTIILFVAYEGSRSIFAY